MQTRILVGPVPNISPISSSDINAGKAQGNTHKTGIPIPGEGETTFYNPVPSLVEQPAFEEAVRKMSCCAPGNDYQLDS